MIDGTSVVEMALHCFPWCAHAINGLKGLLQRSNA